MTALTLLSQRPIPAPRVDLHTVVALERAMRDIAFQRMIDPDSVWDHSVQLHVLAGLADLADRWLQEQVAEARTAGASWTDIGRLLGLPAAEARHRYAPPKPTRPPASTRTTPPRLPLAIE